MVWGSPYLQQMIFHTEIAFHKQSNLSTKDNEAFRFKSNSKLVCLSCYATSFFRFFFHFVLMPLYMLWMWFYRIHLNRCENMQVTRRQGILRCIEDDKRNWIQLGIYTQAHTQHKWHHKTNLKRMEKINSTLYRAHRFKSSMQVVWFWFSSVACSISLYLFLPSPPFSHANYFLLCSSLLFIRSTRSAECLVWFFFLSLSFSSFSVYLDENMLYM